MAAILLTVAGGCRKNAPAEAPEDPAERARKAEVLYRQAEAAPIPEKYEKFKRLFALYDDTPRGSTAYIDYVVVLTRDRPPRLADALDAARKFRDRHPTDPNVGESFLQIADIAWSVKDEKHKKAALDDWSAWLEEHDVAGDLPKATVYMGLMNVRIRQERWEDAIVAADTVVAEPTTSKAQRVEALVRKGNLLGDKLGKKDEARTAFKTALEQARANHASGMHMPGIPPNQIEDELKRLEGG
jgi:hypothetical protein